MDQDDLPISITQIYFSDFFGVSPVVLEDYGAFDISLVNDLPLFIDPFLLFTSEKVEYKNLHDKIIKYVRFLRDKALAGKINDGLLEAWFMFREIKQTWLGFSVSGNSGSGLSWKFARALNRNLVSVFSQFGDEKIAQGSHIEKVCLIDDGIGRDNISDFTTNLIKQYLLEYTQTFAQTHLRPDQRRRVSVKKVRFDYAREVWVPEVYELPYINDDYVILTPVDILTKDETWINRPDLLKEFETIAEAVPNAQLRSEISNYFESKLPEEPREKDRRAAAARTVQEYPVLLEHYIRFKEEHGEEAEALSDQKIQESKYIYIAQVRELVDLLRTATEFYSPANNTLEEARRRVAFLKDVIENKDGYRFFYDSEDRPIRRESDLQILFRLTWFATPSDVNREVNNGRGPVDFSISRGKRDKSLVEFKLAANSSLKRNLQKQLEIYQQASDAPHGLKVIIYFTLSELERIEAILGELGMRDDKNIILIDARDDNKPSASKA